MQKLKQILKKFRGLRISLSLKFIIGVAFALTVAMGVSLYFISKKHEGLIIQQVDLQAKVLFKQVILTRKWIADHGGIFVWAPGKEPKGVKNGGIVQQLMRDIEIECLPTQIPNGIEVDASPLDIGHNLHVSDLPVQEGIKIISDPKEVIITVSAPVVEEVAAPVEAVAAEPELIKK